MICENDDENFSLLHSPTKTIESINNQRLTFVRRIRCYLKQDILNGKINNKGPLSDEALRQVATVRAFDFLDNACCYKDRGCYAELLELAARSAAQETPWKVLEHTALIEWEPWAEDVLMPLIDQAPELAYDEFFAQMKNIDLRHRLLSRKHVILS